MTLVVNHLKSKGSCPAAGDPDAPGNVDSGDGQGCWNALRLQQAQRLRTFVAQLQAGGTNDVLLVGDFNAYAQEDPIFDLTSSGYVDQIGRFNEVGYSYVFDGTAGRLDHALTTATLSPRVAGASDWHINADESVAQDYNLEFKQPACATCAARSLRRQRAVPCVRPRPGAGRPERLQDDRRQPRGATRCSARRATTSWSAGRGPTRWPAARA